MKFLVVLGFPGCRPMTCKFPGRRKRSSTSQEKYLQVPLICVASTTIESPLKAFSKPCGYSLKYHGVQRGFQQVQNHYTAPTIVPVSSCSEPPHNCISPLSTKETQVMNDYSTSRSYQLHHFILPSQNNTVIMVIILKVLSSTSPSSPAVSI